MHWAAVSVSMSTDSARSRDQEDQLDPLLPEESVLTLAEYLEMQEAIGNETRFQIVRVLKERGDLSASEIEHALGIPANNLYYHLDKLVDVGLVHNRKQKTADSEGLYSYYRLSTLGTILLEEGIEALFAREWESLEQYQ